MARLKDGYWLTKDGEVISIYDHYVFLTELEAKVRTELGANDDEARWASSLGIFPVDGWGLVKREPPAARKLRFMHAAFKAGWVRIRRHSDLPYMVLEFWKATDDTMTNIAMGMKELGIKPTETVELHEVGSDIPSRKTAGEIYGRLTGETEEEGFSVHDNPKGKTGVLRMKGGSYCYRVTGNPQHFHGGEQVTVKKNPVEQTVFGGTTYARLFVGLKTSRPFNRQTGLPKNYTAGIETVRQLVEIANYSARNDFKAGYSLVPQEGRYVPAAEAKKLKTKKDLTPKRVKLFREKSVQVVLFPEDGEYGGDIDNYFKRINTVGLALLLQLDQYAVIFELVVNNKFVATGEWRFNKPPLTLKGADVDFRKLAEAVGAIEKKGG